MYIIFRNNKSSNNYNDINDLPMKPTNLTRRKDLLDKIQKRNGENVF